MQAIVLGVCLGAIYGLFFYQRYRSQYFWVFSIASGVASGLLMNLLIRQLGLWDDQFMLAAGLQLGLPSIAILFVNRALAKKSRKRRRNSSEDLDGILPTHSLTSFL
ncbi:MAG TPA: hypothetical protein VFH43_05490 [Candidatus Kapabacteria bacterium]|jgi:hypothetical protein|nr:hypothetical protein [Candidatus Kapabacteria bacterium]